VDDLVVADRQDVVLGVLVEHREGHVVVVVLAVDRVERQVAQRVVHPAHVPLEAEAQAALGQGPGDAMEGGRLLGDHHRAGNPVVHLVVELLEEVDRLEVLIAAVDVRDPFAGLSAVVEVHHRGHRIDP
jgi:hypothetical protein